MYEIIHEFIKNYMNSYLFNFRPPDQAPFPPYDIIKKSMISYMISLKIVHFRVAQKDQVPFAMILLYDVIILYDIIYDIIIKNLFQTFPYI